VLIGYFVNTVDFDPSPGVANLTSLGQSDIFMAKYTSSGAYVFANRFGSTTQDYGFSVTTDASGNIYMIGAFSFTVDFDPGPGVANLISSSGFPNVFFAKYDNSGNYVFAKKLGGLGFGYGNDLALDASGNIFVTGYFQNTWDFDPGVGVVNLASAGANDIFLAKYDNSGNYLFADRMGGTQDDYATSLAIDASSNAYITGMFMGTADFDPGAPVVNLVSAGGSNDIYFAKYNSTGNYVFASRMGANGFDQGANLTLDASGNILVTGAFSLTVDFDPGAGVANLTSSYSDSFFTGKYNSSGTYISAFTSVDTGPGPHAGLSITADASGNVYSTGSFSSTVDFDPGPSTFTLNSGAAGSTFVRKLNSAGALVWVKNFGNTSQKEIVADAAGNSYIIGIFSGTQDFDPGPAVFNMTATGASTDIYVLKLDASGNFVWAKRFGGTGTDLGNTIKVNAAGDVFTAGYYNNTVDFDPGPGTFNLVSAGLDDYYISKLDASGNFIFALSFGSTFADRAHAMCIDASSNIYTTGTFMGTVDFDPGVGTFNMTPNGGSSNDVFIHKLDASGNFLMAKKMGGTGGGEIGYGINLDASGNILSTGTFSAGGDFDPGPAIFNLFGAGWLDTYVSKLDPSGNFIWAKSLGGALTEQPVGIGADPSGNIFTIGYFQSTPCDFDPGPGTYNLPTSGLEDAFVSALDASGNFMWARRAGTAGSDYCYSGYVDAGGSIYGTGSFDRPTGSFSVAVDFDPTGSTYNLIAGDQNDFFVFKWIQCTVLPTPGPISGPTVVCSGATNMYSVAPVGGATSYSWSIPGSWSGTSTTNVIVVTSSLSGGSMVVSAVNACGPSGPSILAISNGTTPVTPGAISGPTAICAGATALYSVAPVGGATSYIWTLPGGWSGSSTTNTINITPSSTGAMSVAATNGCGTSGTRTLNVTVNPSPTVSIAGGTSTVCAGSVVTLTASGAISYLWSTGAITSTIAPSPTISTNYTVTGTSSGCSNAVVKTITVNPLPTLTITGASTVCAGNSVNLTVSGANTYTWSTGSNASSIIVSPTANITYTAGGTDVNGCVNSSVKSITVSALPSVNITGANAICMGSSVLLTASGASSYSWNTGAITTTIAPSPTLNTSYTVVGTSTAGCTNSFVKAITVNPLPVVSINSSTNEVCNGASVLLTASGANTYSWNTGAITTTISPTPSVTTNYTVVGTDLNSCSNSAVVSITVNPLPNVTANASNTLICNGNTVSLSGVGANTYTWTGGVIDGIAFSPIATANYTVTGTSLAGCNNTAVITVSVNNIPANPSPISGPTAACIGAPSTIYSVNPIVGASTYVWSLPAGWSGSSTTNSISATPGVSGGIISVFASNTCGSSATETLNVIVNPSPTVSANGIPMNVCPASNVTLSANGANSYSWSSGALTASTVVNPIATTIYTVTGIDGNACSNFTTVTIGVFISPTVSAASSTNILCLGQSATLTASGAITYSWSTGSTSANIVVSPNTTTSYTLTGIDGNSCGGTFVFTQSVTVCAAINNLAFNIQNSTFLLYPNPTGGILNVECQIINENTHFQLFNVIGELLMDEPIRDQNETFNIRQFANGIYFVRVGSFTGKIIKE
jgi:hypothetical protein